MSKYLTLGSLFDGSGGFPLAGIMCGIEPLWASKVDPFCISVTEKRIPSMQHLGDITKINGAEIPPVDIITFGSPCQDMSVAGKRAGLEGERSVLFMDAVRIIKEMRGATNGEYPKFIIWENVPGAFSSNKGEDFRTVLEELSKIQDENVSIPQPQKGKWHKAGCIVGDGYSLAWRVLDAQFWGVPQRRKRIFLVGSFGSECAAEILFKREGLSRDFGACRDAWKRITAIVKNGAGVSGYAAGFKGRAGSKAGNIGYSERISPTLQAEQSLHCLHETLLFDSTQITSKTNHSNPQLNSPCHTLSASGSSPVLCASFYPQRKAESQCFRNDNISNTLVNGTSAGFHNAVLYLPDVVLNDQGGSSISVEKDLCPTLRAQSHGNEPCVMSNTSALCIAGNTIDRKIQSGGNGKGVIEEKSYTLNTIDRHAVMSQVIDDNDIELSLFDNHGRACRYKGPIDVAPTLAASYGMGGNNTPFAVESNIDLSRFIVRRITPLECCRLQGFPDWWCDEIPHKDTPEYRMWGNGVALP